jgi:hypothetical protein
MDETRLYFAVGGFGDDAQVVSELLRLTPTRVGLRGDLTRHGLPRRAELWALESKRSPAEPFQAHLEALLGQLEQHSAGVREVARRFHAVFQCHSHFETANPGFAIPAELLARVAALGVGFDFDLYVIYADESETQQSESPAV